MFMGVAVGGMHRRLVNDAGNTETSDFMCVVSLQWHYEKTVEWQKLFFLKPLNKLILLIYVIMHIG